jgi:hypothetical protein
MQVFSIGSSTTEAKADDSAALDDGDAKEIVNQMNLLNGVVAYDGNASEELCVTPPSPAITKCGSSTTFANISVAGKKLAEGSYAPGTAIPIDHFQLPQPLPSCAQGSDFNGKLILGEFLDTTDAATGVRNLHWNALHLIGDAGCSSPLSKIHVDLVDTSGAEGAAVVSPGVVSGNTIQVPILLPIHLCGNAIDIVGLLNPTFGNTCVNR